MKVMFVPYPLTAHLYDIVPMAWALRSAGHEVCIACQPGTFEPNMIDQIIATGLTAVPLGVPEDLVAMVDARHLGETPELSTDALAVDHADPKRWEWNIHCLAYQFAMHYSVQSSGGLRRPVVDHLVDQARGWQPDLMLWDPLVPAAPVAARACGAAHARLLWGLDNVAWLRAKWLKRPTGPTDPLVHSITPMLARYGYEFEEEMLVGQWSLDLVPSGMRLPLDLPYVPVRRVPFNGAAALPDWLYERPDRPRVCLTLGVTGRPRLRRTDHAEISVVRLLELVANLDVELVATVNAEQLAGLRNLPDNIRVIDYLPLNLLLPTCSAIIHHGGAGTFATAVANKVPQLIAPVPKWDEAVLAAHVAAAGAGLVMDRHGADVDETSKQLLQVLTDPSFRDGAAALYEDTLATPSPSDVVPVLEELTARHRGAGQ